MDGEGMDGKAFGLKRKWTEKEMYGKRNVWKRKWTSIGRIFLI